MASDPLPISGAEQTNARWFFDEVHTHERSLKAYLRGAFPSVRDVDDVVQESYLRIWKARLAKPIRSSKQFLFQVARHLAVDRIRRDRVSPIDRVTELNEVNVIDTAPTGAELACTREEVRLLAEAIHSLPARCQEVIILRQIHGMPQKEIAARLGISVLTVQVHVVKGLRRLEEFFARHGFERTRR
jgi:RNA polymerase sigma factor (sigma-70 family)